MRILLAIATSTLTAVRRLLKRLASPGSGPFFAGC
jgi:hypothetical protein